MADQPETSEKERQLIRALVQRYITVGQPVGSKVLSEDSGLKVSSATIRNIMADLETRGFVSSPHTSAGRVPTAQAYRLFVDHFLTLAPLTPQNIETMSRELDPDLTAEELVKSASGILSEVTQLAGLVTIPRKDLTVLRQVEFLPLTDNRVLAILVLDDHEVQNRVIYTGSAYTDIQLREAANFINQSFMGMHLNAIRRRVIDSMQSDQTDMNELMSRTRALAEQALGAPEEGDYVLAGQENLIDLTPERAIADIRELFKAFSLKGDILHLLDKCMESDGVQLFIGQESGYEILDECTVVTSPYHVGDTQVGVLGVVGPTRMAYDKVIPVVNATAQLLGQAFDTTRRNHQE